MKVWRFALCLCAFLIMLCSPAILPRADAEPLPFRRAMEMAVARSSTAGAARADQVRAQQSYLEARNAFFPTVVIGSGLGMSVGFPLSLEGAAPSIINVNSQQFLLNFAQHDFIRAARREWMAASHFASDKRNQVILEAALAYVELDVVISKLNLLREEEAEASKAEQVVAERAREGVDSTLEQTKARLASARVHMRMAEAQGTADLLRERLGQLTGLAPQSIETLTESIPPLPDIRPDENLTAKAIQASPAVKTADERAASKDFRARGERKNMYPAVDLAGQYALLSRFNNYDEFYRKFQRHNGTFGVNIRFPFFSPSQRARAEAAEAEALGAKKEAESVRGDVAANTLKLQRAIRQLAAAREVAQLEYQLAMANLDAVQAKIESGQATIRDEQSARLEINARYAAVLDTGFELDKARLQLLQATGEIDGWALK